MACRDRRLHKAFDAVEKGAIQVLSLDIFETLVWRTIAEPDDLYLILGKRLKQEGWLIPALSAENFASVRISAEKTARKEKQLCQGSNEVTLSEIYWKMEHLFVKLTCEEFALGNKIGIFGADLWQMVQKELLLHKELLRLDPDIHRLAQLATEKAIPVILVSDTYFEEEQIRFLLPLSLPFTCFLSCEHGYSKGEGLFRVVLSQLNIPPSEILHVGDNSKSDIASASRAGLQTVHFMKATGELKEIYKREWPEDLISRGKLLSSKDGDFGLSYLRTKISYCCPSENLKREERFYWHYGATILGPVLLGFVSWIYQRCKEMGQTEVYCLMREGKLYAHLIERVAPYFPDYPLKAKTLWLSRQFITHAAITRASKQELTNALSVFFSSCTLEEFCTHLGVKIEKIQKWEHRRHMRLECPSVRKSLIHFLITQPDLRRQILFSSEAKRERFLNYLFQHIPLNSAQQITLVDSGWNGISQTSLQKILQQTSSALVHGLYLGTTDVAQEALLSGSICEGYLFNGGLPYSGNAYRRGCFVLEQTATAETGVGPLLDFSADGKPLHYPYRIDPEQKKQAEAVQLGIFAFFDRAGEALKAKEIHLSAHPEELKQQLRTILLRSMLNPTQNEAHHFGLWLHEHAPTNQLTQVIGAHPYYDRFIKDMLPTSALREISLNWPFAYAAKQSKALTLTAEAAWLKRVPHQCFLSEDHYDLKIFLDTGEDFSNKPHKTVVMRSNPNRHFFTIAQFFSHRKAIARILLNLTCPSACIRIKSLRLITYDRLTSYAQTNHFFETKEESQLVCLEGIPIDHNTFQCAQHLKLLYAFPNPNIYQLKLKLCFEMFTIEHLA